MLPLQELHRVLANLFHPTEPELHPETEVGNRLFLDRVCRRLPRVALLRVETLRVRKLAQDLLPIPFPHRLLLDVLEILQAGKRLPIHGPEEAAKERRVAHPEIQVDQLHPKTLHRPEELPSMEMDQEVLQDPHMEMLLHCTMNKLVFIS